jgi:hypothetical protein
MVVRGSVLDMSSYLKNRATSKFLGDWVDNMIVDHIGYDATRALTHSNQFSDITQCLIDSMKERKLKKTTNIFNFKCIWLARLRIDRLDALPQI